MAKLIQEMITMLCGIVSLVCILRQQHYIQLQNEEIQRIREYSLSAKACAGILNRASRRGKPLPPELEAALILQSRLE